MLNLLQCNLESAVNHAFCFYSSTRVRDLVSIVHGKSAEQPWQRRHMRQVLPQSSDLTKNQTVSRPMGTTKFTKNDIEFLASDRRCAIKFYSRDPALEYNINKLNY